LKNRSIETHLGVACVVGMLSTAWAATTDVKADASWTEETIHDPVHRGGKIVNAQTTTQVGESDLDVWLRCWTATGVRDTRFVVRNHLPQLSGDIAWWFDRDKARSGKWRLSASGDAVVLPDAMQDEFTRLMRSRRSLHVRLTDSDGEELEFAVSLSGSNRALMDIASCARGP